MEEKLRLVAQLFVNGLVVGAVYGFFALGFAIVFGVTRIFHLAHAAVYTAAAYAFFALQTRLALPFAVSLLLSAAIAALVGLGCELLVYRPLRKRGADSHLVLVAALGIIIVAENLIVLFAGPAPRSVVQGGISRSYEVLGVVLSTPQLVVVTGAVLTLLASYVFTRLTPMGRQMTAVGDNAELAEVVGISVRRIYTVAFIAGSIVAAVSAIVVARSTGIHPGMGFDPVLVGSVAVILAGTGRVVPAFLAGVTIGLLENLAVLRLPSEYQPTVMFAALILVLLARPYGIFGTQARSLLARS